MGNITLSREYLTEGDESYCRSIIPHVLSDTPEMTWGRSREEATEDLIEATEDHMRIEFLARDGDALVGFASLMDDMDPNVGQCLSIHSFFVLPEYRGVIGQRMFRQIVREAREYNVEILGHSQRVSEGVFTIRYIKLNRSRK